MSDDGGGHRRKNDVSDRELEPRDIGVGGAAIQLATEIEFATPFELREAARTLDDMGNDPATKQTLRPIYRALSDVIKLALK